MAIEIYIYLQDTFITRQTRPGQARPGQATHSVAQMYSTTK